MKRKFMVRKCFHNERYLITIPWIYKTWHLNVRIKSYDETSFPGQHLKTRRVGDPTRRVTRFQHKSVACQAQRDAWPGLDDQNLHFSSSILPKLNPTTKPSILTIKLVTSTLNNTISLLKTYINPWNRKTPNLDLELKNTKSNSTFWSKTTKPYMYTSYTIPNEPFESEINLPKCLELPNPFLGE